MIICAAASRSTSLTTKTRKNSEEKAPPFSEMSKPILGKKNRSFADRSETMHALFLNGVRLSAEIGATFSATVETDSLYIVFELQKKLKYITLINGLKYYAEKNGTFEFIIEILFNIMHATLTRLQRILRHVYVKSFSFQT